MEARDFFGENSSEELAAPVRIPVGVGDVEGEIQETCHLMRFGAGRKRVFKTRVQVVVVRVKGVNERVFLGIMSQRDRATQGTAGPERTAQWEVEIKGKVDRSEAD